MHRCRSHNVSGEDDKALDGSRESVRFVRAPDHDMRVAHGDDFAGDAWLDRKTRQIVYGTVGHDRNATA
jgi:hypothetical protein